MSGTSTQRGVLYGVLGSLLSACFLIPWKLATHHGDPEHATLVLLASAALLSSLAMLPAHGSGPPVAVGLTLKLAAAFAVLSLAGNWFSAESVHRVSGPLLAVLQRCEVLVVGVLSPLVLREPARRSYWLGAAVAGAGLVVLNAQLGEGDTARADAYGAVCGLLSAVCFGTMAVLTRRHIRALRPVLLNAVRLWLALALWLVLNGGFSWSSLSPKLVLFAALAAFFGPFLSRLAVMESARHVAAGTTVLTSLLTPPTTLVLGFLVLGTLPLVHEVLGGVIMLIGVAIPVLAALRAEKRSLAIAQKASLEP